MNTLIKKRKLQHHITILIFFLLPFTFVNAQVVIQRCDLTTGWSGNQTISRDLTDKQEGQASLKIEGANGDQTWFAKSFTQTRTGIDQTGYLCMWLYVSDATKLEGGTIEISSSGGSGNRVSSWYFDKNSVINGWNQMQLSIASATTTDEGASLDSINYFRITQNTSGSVTAKIDFVRFTPSLDEPTWPRLDVPEVDNTTLNGKVMFGYQGWFNHPDDGAGLGWVHWGNFYDPINSTVDMYPDMREYGMDEKYRADLTFPNGRMAPVYSSHNRNSVVRHMKWVRDYNLDGVFLQRFISGADSQKKMDHKDTVTTHIMEGCEKYGRIFAIMYDGIGNRVEDIKSDWMHLVDDINVTSSDRYLSHRGMPLVALWGYTVRDSATVDQLVELIDWFKNNPNPAYRASLLLGVAWDWYNETSDWMNAFKDVEVISPWFSGNTDYDRGQAWCDDNNVDFLPVVHPGFSWHNLKGATQNMHPREGGNFFWNEVHDVLAKNARSVYIAMFDEIDEGTAMFKLAENDEQLPVEGYWLPLDEDGYSLPSDWYLRAATLASEVVRGYEDNHAQFITPPEGIMTIRIINEVNDNDQGAMVFIFPDFPGESTIEISIDGGSSFAYSTPDNAGIYSITGLTEGDYQVLVRHGEGKPEVDMGEVAIGNSIELMPTAATGPYPEDQAENIRIEPILGWNEGLNVQTHVIYFGTSNPPDSVHSQKTVSYSPGELEEQTTYYWRVDERNAFGSAEGPVWSFTTGESGESGDFLVLDYCDSKAGWESHNVINLDSEQKKEGFACLSGEGDGTAWFRKSFETPLDTRCNTNSYLDFWLYVSDVSMFDGGGQVEISSSGGPDTNEYNWSVRNIGLSNGWNEVHLRIGDAGQNGNPDLSAINFFRIYQNLSGDVKSQVDFIHFSGLINEPLTAPQNLVATAGDELVNLDWDDHTSTSLIGYNIFRSEDSSGPYSKLNGSVISVSEYEDVNVTNNETYYYQVTALDASGNESPASSSVFAIPTGSSDIPIERASDIRIYPNPAGEFFILKTEHGISARLIDITGRTVKHINLAGSETLVSISNINPGVYYLEVRQGKNILIQKLVKQ